MSLAPSQVAHFLKATSVSEPAIPGNRGNARPPLSDKVPGQVWHPSAAAAGCRWRSRQQQHKPWLPCLPTPGPLLPLGLAGWQQRGPNPKQPGMEHPGQALGDRTPGLGIYLATGYPPGYGPGPCWGRQHATSQRKVSLKVCPEGNEVDIREEVSEEYVEWQSQSSQCWHRLRVWQVQ